MASISPAEFLTNLSRERDGFRQFLEILESEQDALIQGEIDKLTGLAQNKSGTAPELAQLGEARNRYLAENGLPPDQAGMSAWLASPTAAPYLKDAREVWEELLTLARAARQLNETNGAMITLKLQHNQQALAVLMSAANQASLYGPDGQHLAGGSGRHLDKV